MLFDIVTGKGMFQPEWWVLVAIALVLTHLTIICVTIYLHRCQAHCSLELSPLVSHPMRFWLWFSTGLITAQWVAVHRKHHATVETEDDPHSPAIHGIKEVLYRGAELYRDESFNQQTVEKYSHHLLPKDWLERNVYTTHPSLGIFIAFVVQFLLFGFFGIVIWAVQMVWIPFFAAGVINGLGHFKGYRNFATDDNSTNISSIGILIGGEELHNNHHAYPSSAKFSIKWWEFDIGWLYVKVLSALKLARVLRLAPVPKKRHHKLTEVITPATLEVLIQGRPHVLCEYATNVIKPIFKAELASADKARRKLLAKAKNALFLHERHTIEQDISALKEVALNSWQLQKVYEFKRTLEDMLHNCRNQHQLLQSLQDWCHQAEKSGIEVLSNFSERIRNYSLHPQHGIRSEAI